MTYATTNLGKIDADVLPYAQLGDGATSTTFPTLRTAGRPGFSLDGGDWIQLDDPFAYNQPFSVAALLWSELGGATGNAHICGTYNSATTIGMRLGAANHTLEFVLDDDAGNTLGYRSTAGILTSRVQAPIFVVGTYSGDYANLSSMNMYLNSEQLGVVTTMGTGIASSISSGRPLCIGGYWNGTALANAWSGTLYAFAVYPFELTPVQVAELERRMRQYARSR